MIEIFDQPVAVGDYVAFDHFGGFDLGCVTTPTLIKYLNSQLRAEPHEVFKIETNTINWFLLNHAEHRPEQDLFYRTLRIGDQVLVVCDEAELMIAPYHINTFIKLGTVVKQEATMNFKIKVNDHKSYIFRSGDSIIKIDKTV